MHPVRLRFRLGCAARAACALIALGAGRDVGAQRNTLHVDHFTVDDGLAQGHMTAVVQDSVGYIWTGTTKGLQRFDGYRFVSHSELDPSSPPQLSQFIIGLRVDSAGHLWVATQNTVFRRHARTGHLTRIQLDHDLHTWAFDSAGRLWVYARQFLWIDTSSEPPRIGGKVPGISLDTSDVCGSLAVTGQGDLWLTCHQRGKAFTLRVDPSTRRVQKIGLVSVAMSEDALVDAAGRIWVGGQGGLDVIDPRTATVRTIDLFRHTSVGALLPVRDSGIIVLNEGLSGGALVQIDSAGRVMGRWAPREVFGEAPLAHDAMIDREGSIWIATTTAGLYRLDRTRPIFDHVSSRSTPPLPFASDFVMALREARDGSLWAGTLRGGAYRVSSDWSHVDAFSPLPNARGTLPTVEVWDIDEDRNGGIWLSTTSGLCSASAYTIRCRKLPSGDSSVVQAEMDPDGWLWLAPTSDPILSFNPARGVFGPYSPIQGPAAIYVDRDSSYLWMSGTLLHRARIAGGKFVGPIEEVPRAASLGVSVVAFHRDHEGVMWLGTGQGLERWDVSGRRFVPIGIPELRGTTVFSIQEDAQHRLWLGTAHGLVQYSPSTGISRRYRRQDGVLNPEFNRRAAIIRRNGEMVFGGINGLTIFTPERVTRPRDPTPVVFTRWRKVTSTGVVEGSFTDPSMLSVGPSDRATTIEFAALGFAAGPTHRYRYRLEGVNSEWVESSDHAVTYAALPRGRLTFRVQAAAGSEGQWHEPGAALQLTVVPPVWQTTWFRALVVMIVVMASWMLHRLRLRQALATERLRLRISRDLHDEIGAGLSSIALLSDSVSGNGGVGERERAQLQRIGQSARQMVDDLRDIVWAIDPDADRLEQVVSRMRDVADSLLPGARVRFHAPASDAMAGSVGMTARRDLLLIYKELLHNIARHANAAEVDIRLTARQDELELVVADDGRGFDGTLVRSGTGLKSMRERAARIGARLELVSGDGTNGTRGTTATLTVRRT